MRTSLQAAGRRLAAEEGGFTVMELLIVMILLGILFSIALPGYLGFQDRARKSAATARIREAVNAIDAYELNNYAGAPTASDPDWNGSDAAGTGTNGDNGLTGLTFTILHDAYDPGLSASAYVWDHDYTPASVTDYCVYTSVGVWYAAERGAAATVTTGRTMVENTCTAQ